MRKYVVTRTLQEYLVTIKYVEKATGETYVHEYITSSKPNARKEAAKFTKNNPEYGVYDVEVKPSDKVLFGITEDNFVQVAEYIATKPATPNNAEQED